MIQVVLWVADVEKSLAFYSEKMGFKPGTPLPGPDGRPTFSDMYWGDTQVLIEGKPEFTAPAASFELYVKLPNEADIDKLYADMRTHGVEIYHPMKEEFWGELSFGAKDINGFLWRFAKTVREVSVEEMTEHSKKGAN